jgi:hypothetical protein
MIRGKLRTHPAFVKPAVDEDVDGYNKRTRIPRPRNTAAVEEHLKPRGLFDPSTIGTMKTGTKLVLEIEVVEGKSPKSDAYIGLDYVNFQTNNSLSGVFQVNKLEEIKD